jgi:hypothetical protein
MNPNSDAFSRRLAEELEFRKRQNDARDVALQAMLDDVARKQRMSDYRDYADIALSHSPVSSKLSLSAAEMRQQQASLPDKLHAILSNPNYEHIISWLPHGRAWKIHNLTKFSTLILPLYFDMGGDCGSLNVFLRYLKVWGFRQFTEGPDIAAYYHEVSLVVIYTRNSTCCYLPLLTLLLFIILITVIPSWDRLTSLHASIRKQSSQGLGELQSRSRSLRIDSHARHSIPP